MDDSGLKIWRTWESSQLQLQQQQLQEYETIDQGKQTSDARNLPESDAEAELCEMKTSLGLF